MLKSGMSSKEYLEFQKKCCEEMIAICEKKNADYAGGGDDAFANFTGIESVCGSITTEMGFLTRMYDKFSRIGSFIQNGNLKVKDESVKDTLLDLANYCILFAGYLESTRKIPQENILAQDDMGANC